MKRSRFKWLIGFALLIAIPGFHADAFAFPTTIQIVASADETAESVDGGNTWGPFTIPDPSVYASFVPGGTIRRQLFAFPLDALPSGATVLSVRFQYYVIATGDTPDQVVTFFGGAGDGVLPPQTALNTPDFLGESVSLNSIGPDGTQFSEQVFQELLLSSATHIEVVGVPRQHSMHVGFSSIEENPPANRPTLEVIYAVPEPTGALAAGMTAITIARRARTRRWNANAAISPD